MSAKKPREFYENLAKTRNHRLIDVSNSDTPSKGTLTIQCDSCNNQFTTTAHSYQNARRTGCPNCKQTSTSTQWKGKTKTLSPEQAAQRAVTKAHREATRLKKAQKYSSLKNREDLILFLESESNIYSEFILARMNEPPPEGPDVEQHHIIPLHTGGPDTDWNLIPLTSENHLRAHEIRAEVYKEAGDINASRLRGEQDITLRERRLKAARLGDTTRKQQESGIYAPGASSKGGQIGGKVKSLAKDLGHESKMTEPVKKVLREGSKWEHNKTGSRVELGPKEVNTLPQLVDKLIEALPHGEDRDQLKGGNITTVTSNLARVIKGDRKTTYGWSLIS